MKSKNKQNLAEKSFNELKTALEESKKALASWKLKKDKAGKEIMQGSHLRREIAQISTYLVMKKPN